MSIVCNELLGRELLKIYQDTECFNFSLDSILLANFVTINKRTKKICDLCTGNAPIPLYLSLRTESEIIGVEIQQYSFNLGLKSVMINCRESQINLLNKNLINIHEEIGKHTFDCVTCNPPFYKVGSFNQNPDIRKSIARHEIMCTLDDICKEASLLLNSGGVFAMVHRPDTLTEILETLTKYNLEPKRIRFVHPKRNKQANHLLIEAVKDGKAGGLKVLEPLIVYNDDNKWTDEVIKIYNYEEE